MLHVLWEILSICRVTGLTHIEYYTHFFKTHHDYRQTIISRYEQHLWNPAKISFVQTYALWRISICCLFVVFPSISFNDSIISVTYLSQIKVPLKLHLRLNSVKIYQSKKSYNKILELFLKTQIGINRFFLALDGDCKLYFYPSQAILYPYYQKS